MGGVGLQSLPCCASKLVEILRQLLLAEEEEQSPETFCPTADGPAGLERWHVEDQEHHTPASELPAAEDEAYGNAS